MFGSSPVVAVFLALFEPFSKAKLVLDTVEAFAKLQSRKPAIFVACLVLLGFFAGAKLGDRTDVSPQARPAMPVEPPPIAAQPMMAALLDSTSPPAPVAVAIATVTVTGSTFRTRARAPRLRKCTKLINGRYEVPGLC